MFKDIKNKGTLKGNFPEKCIPYQLYPSGSDKKKLYHYGKLYTSRFYAVKIFHLNDNRFYMLLNDGEVNDINYKHDKANRLMEQDYKPISLLLNEINKVELNKVELNKAKLNKLLAIELYMNNDTDLKAGGKTLDIDSITQEGWLIANIIVSSGLHEGVIRLLAESVKIFSSKNSDYKPYSLHPPLSLIPVLVQEESEHNGIDLITFKSKTNEQERKRKPNFIATKSTSNNKTLEYGIVRNKGSSRRIIIKLEEEFDPKLHILCGSNDNNIKLPLLDSLKVYHYAIVLTFNSTKYDIKLPTSDNISSLHDIVVNYLGERGIDIRGMWYDNSKKNNNIHFNLHVANRLPLDFFRVDFDLWNCNFGKADVEYCYDPVLWRIYASRNEVMKKGLSYVCKYIAFGHFTKIASNLKSNKQDVKEMANYSLIHEKYLQDDVVGYQYRNHCLICFEYLGEEIQELRDVINTPAKDLYNVMKQMNLSLKYELARELQEKINKLRDEKIEWVQSNGKERIVEYTEDDLEKELANLSLK